MKLFNKSKCYKLMAATSLLFSANSFATMSCGHVDNGDGTSTYKCSSTYSGGGNNGGGIDFSVLYDGKYADIFDISENPYPNAMLLIGYEQSLEQQFDKNPWDAEAIGDLAQALVNAKLLINYIILNYNLTDAMKAKLLKALSQANTLVTTINSGVQITNHLINNELGYAGSEIATVIGGIIIAAGGTALTAAGTPIIVSASIVLISNVVLLPKLEAWADSYLEQYNHPDFLNTINEKFDIPNIYQMAEDAMVDLYCASIPAHKQQDIGICSIPPIILDLDGNGIDFLTLAESKVYFDVNNDGVNDNVSWPTKGNAVLFADWNSSGIVDSRTEFMFSLYSIKKHASDLEGLKLFDYEDDNDIDSKDVIYEKLFVWDDRNEDGICTTDEVSSLDSLGITLHFSPNETKKNHKKPKGKHGNKIENEFNFKINGVNGLAVSTALRAKIN